MMGFSGSSQGCFGVLETISVSLDSSWDFTWFLSIQISALHLLFWAEERALLFLSLAFTVLNDFQLRTNFPFNFFPLSWSLINTLNGINLLLKPFSCDGKQCFLLTVFYNFYLILTDERFHFFVCLLGFSLFWCTFLFKPFVFFSYFFIFSPKTIKTNPNRATGLHQWKCSRFPLPLAF